jgi:HEAT repeat protein
LAEGHDPGPEQDRIDLLNHHPQGMYFEAKDDRDGRVLLFSGRWSGSGSGKSAGNGKGVRLPVNRAFERELAQLESMEGEIPDVAGVERLRRALDSQNNYLVSKAAKIVEDHNIGVLLPEVRSAYERFFINPIETDPQCWAKNALVKTLVKLGCREAAVYLRGLQHHQNEPVWGGQADTAGELRGSCTQALLLCGEPSGTDLLSILLEPLLDEDKSVRMEAARAIGQIGGITAALLLKLRILIRKEEPEILGACFSALLGMGHNDKLGSIALVADFLQDGEEAAAEAAFALAETHEPAALAALIERRRKGTDAWFGSVLDHAIVLTRLQAGMDFLLAVIEQDTRTATSALEAISRLQNSPKVRARVAAAVAKSKSERAQLAFRKFFPELDLDPRNF